MKYYSSKKVDVDGMKNCFLLRTRDFSKTKGLERFTGNYSQNKWNT